MADEQRMVGSPEAGQTLAAALRKWRPDQSWSQIRRLVASRQVTLNGELCVDAARRLQEGDAVDIRARPSARPRQAESVVIRHLDEHVVVVEKPSGLATTRHPSERNWSKVRKELTPTLEDIVPRLIAASGGRRVERQRPKQARLARLRIVQRLDKETSGLLVFARTVEAERLLGQQFRKHTVIRKYLAIIPGYLPPQSIQSRLVRNRGDGRRGSITLPDVGKEAITHIDVLERLPGYTILSCRLETGRTHQIRIHLAEKGHPVCGDKVYQRTKSGATLPDASGAPRLALHAAELGFVHPVSGATLHWEMPLPSDLREFVERIRCRESGGQTAAQPDSARS